MKKQARINKNVYLTFDDGIQPGTSEVLNILDKNEVIGTFFLTGINTCYFMDDNYQEALEIYMSILKRHVVGNHSFSHAHGFYSSYYKIGLLVDNNNRRSTVREDFEKNQLFFNGLFPSLPHSIKKIGRLPGRNSWKLQSPCFKKCFQSIEGDSSIAVNDLSADGYNLFGWDDEWKMNFYLTKQTRAEVENGIAKKQIDFSDSKQVFPKIDLEAMENSQKDRPSEQWTEVAERILSRQETNLVLLMHDRAFRPSSTNEEILGLDKFIKYLKSNNVNFTGIDNYSF